MSVPPSSSRSTGNIPRSGRVTIAETSTLGVRFRLSTKSEGLWAGSGGDRATFGLNSTQLIDGIDLLKKEGFLDCLRLFHYHQGSQLPNIRAIREAAIEAVRVYVSLVEEGAPMGLLDLGSFSDSRVELGQCLFAGIGQTHLDKGNVVQPQSDRIQHRLEPRRARR